MDGQAGNLFGLAPPVQRNLAHEEFLDFRLRFYICLMGVKAAPGPMLFTVILSFASSTEMVLMSILNPPLRGTIRGVRRHWQIFVHGRNVDDAAALPAGSSGGLPLETGETVRSS